MTVQEEYERLALPLVEKYTSAPMTAVTYATMEAEVRNLEMTLNQMFYPEEYEVVLGLDEANRRMVMGYREKLVPIHESLTYPDLRGFKRLLPRDETCGL